MKKKGACPIYEQTPFHLSHCNHANLTNNNLINLYSFVALCPKSSFHIQIHTNSQKQIFIENKFFHPLAHSLSNFAHIA